MFMIKRRGYNSFVYVTLSVVMMIFVAFPVFAEAMKVTHYEEIAYSHLYADEFSKVALYYNYRAMMYYELANNTKDIGFIIECKNALNDLIYNLDELFDTPICSRDLQGIIDSLMVLAKRNLDTVDYLLSRTDIFVVGVDTAMIKGMIGEADELNDMIEREINPLISQSKLDLMSLSNLSFAVHGIQQLQMMAIYDKVSSANQSDDIYSVVAAESTRLMEYFINDLQRVIDKTQDPVYKELKIEMRDRTISLRDISNELISKVSQYRFPSENLVEMQTDFIELCKGIDNVLRTQVIGVEFT